MYVCLVIFTSHWSRSALSPDLAQAMKEMGMGHVISNGEAALRITTMMMSQSEICDDKLLHAFYKLHHELEPLSYQRLHLIKFYDTEGE